MKIQLDRQ
ncbi:hypothetical protein AYI70_g6588, partial [Smittium culicis]